VRLSRSSYLPAALALLLPLAVSPLLVTPTWSLRFCILCMLGVLGLGLVTVELAVDRQREVLLAAAFLGWALLSTLFSATPHLALWGLFAWGTGLVFVAALVGAWILGRRSGPGTERIVVIALFIALGVNALVAVGQAVVPDAFERADLGLVAARAAGLMGNPIYLAPLLAGAIWIASSRSTGAAKYLLLIVLFGVALQLTGSRGGLLVAIVCVLAAPGTFRSRTVRLAALIVGLGLGGVLLPDVSASARIAADGSGGGVTPRLESWLAGAHAVTDHPVFGAGPGRFEAAATPYRTLKFAHAEDPYSRYVDAHDFVVEYAVTTGIPGVLLLLGWLGLALRRAGPRTTLGGFAVAVLAVQLVEPLNVVGTPLAFLALGVAASSRSRRGEGAAVGWHRVVLGSTAVGGLTLASVLAFGLYSLNEARLDFEIGAAKHADRLLPRWWQAPEQVARYYVLKAHEDRRPELLRNALAARQRAAADDPYDPQPQGSLAQSLLQVNDVAGARRVYVRMVEHDPWSVDGLNGLAVIDAHDHRFASAERYARRSLLADPTQTSMKKLIADVRRAQGGTR
jgi:O-antigen ligase